MNQKNKLWICTGPLDELLFGCNHNWQEFREAGCKDDKTYTYCPSCGLVCAVALGEHFPPECVIARKQQLEKKCSGKCKTKE